MSEILLSQLAHVELISPKPEETVALDGRRARPRGDHARGPVGLSARVGGVAAFKPDRHRGPASRRSGTSPGARYGPDDPETIAERLKGSGQEIGWVDSSVGHGRAFRYRAPVGRHVHEVFWETELYQAPPDKAEPRLPEPSAEVLRAGRVGAVSRSRHYRDTRASTRTSPSTARWVSATPLRSAPSRASTCSRR